MRFLSAIISVILATFLAASALHAGSPPVFSDESAGAIRGYDPVAYFVEDAPLKGSPDLTYEWNGATWHFASADNREKFISDPEAYTPQYGGYCAWAASKGYIASTDPTAWTVHDGKLYLNYSHRVHKRWSRDIEGNIERGDMNWPGILD